MSDFPQPETPASSPVLPNRARIGAYRHEQTLFVILAIFGTLFWLTLTLVTFGTVWIYLLFGLLISIIGASALISHLHGNAIEVLPDQFPDLHQRFEACCQRIGMKKTPRIFLMNGDGMLNAFATRFLRRYYVVLLAQVVEALDDDPEAINFYIGHELGHIHRGHLSLHWLVGPMHMLPLLGSAHRRAQEYTCDQYGAACCARPESITHALTVLAAGPRRWKQVNATAFLRQMGETSGFWMSLNELTSEYPWLSKRLARALDPEAKVPGRHPLAYLIAFFLPGGGAGGLIVGSFFFVMILGILAAIAIPSYMEYTTRAKLIPVFSYGRTLTAAVGQHYTETGDIPESVASLKIVPAPEYITESEIDSDNGIVTLTLKGGKTVRYEPSQEDGGQVTWQCSTTVPHRQLPQNAECETSEDSEDSAPSVPSLGSIFGR